VKKEPYVKEEVVLKKRRVTETKTITEEVKSERLLDSSEKAENKNDEQKSAN
jgi:stress response protein YsnF